MRTGVDFTMNKTIVILLGMILLSAVMVQAIPGTIDQVTVNGETLNPVGGNSVTMQRGQSFTVKVRVSATSPIPDAQVLAFISGFDVNTPTGILSDSSGVFDMSNNNTVIQTLHLTIPDTASKDNYRLRVVFSDRNGNSVMQEYPILITPPRHAVVIQDILLDPSSSVAAGHSLLASVHMKNIGDQNEQDIKVTVSIPALNLQATDFINQMNSDESATSEQLFFRIPVCTKAGTYPVQVTVEYDDGYKSVTQEQPISVTASSQCGLQNAAAQQALVSVSPPSATLTQGKGGNFVTITLSNPTVAAKSYVLSTQGQNGVQVRFSPSNVVVVPPSAVQTVYLFFAADANAPVGSQALTLTVKDLSGNTLDTGAVRVDVAQAAAAGSQQQGASFVFGSDALMQSMLIGLVVLLVVLFALGVYLVTSKPPRENEPPRALNKTYY